MGEQRPFAGVALRIALALPLFLTIGGLATAYEATGRVEGSVTLGRQLVSRRSQFRLYPDAMQSPKRAEPASIASELKNVVVYLESAPGKQVAVKPKTGPFQVEQKDLEFQPHVLAVAKGTTVEFPNQDLVFHNVFSLSKAASFDLGRYPSGSAKSVRFDTPGVVKVFCHIHSDMAAILLVLDSWLFTTPTEEGRFALDVPPGDYTIVAWHERARLSSKKIRVEAGHTVVLDFVIPLLEPEEGG